MATITEQPPAQRAHTWEATKEHRNVGGWERGARLLVGVGASAAAFATGVVWLKALFGVVGAAGLLTGASGYCPANKAAGRDSYHLPRL